MADARFAKPFDEAMITNLAQNHDVLVVIEEAACGGFGAHVLSFMSNAGLLEDGLKVRTMTMPDIFIEQGAPAQQIMDAALDGPAIVACVLKALGRGDEISKPASA